jgi:glycosidase
MESSIIPATTSSPSKISVKERETSPYKDWYFVKRFPIRKIQDRAMTYVGWNGYAYMPKINSHNEGWQAYVEQLVRKYDLEGIGGCVSMLQRKLTLYSGVISSDHL